MYLGDESRALSIENHVSLTQQYRIFTFNLKNGYKSKVEFFVKIIHEMSGPTPTHLYVTQINSTRFHFIGTIELIMCLKFLKTDLKWKFEILEIENF